MPKVLFICHANVGRSQIAEAYYNHLTKSKDGFSAGVSKEAPLKYPVLPQELIDLMLEEGIDMSKQKPKTVTEEIVEQSDKIYVMCKKEQCPDFLLKSEKAAFWDVADPHMMTVDETRNIRNLIKSNILSIL